MNVKKSFLFLFVGLSLIPSSSMAGGMSLYFPSVSQALNKYPYAAGSASAVAGLATMYLASPYMKIFLSRNDPDALCDAIASGNLNKASWLIRFGANVNQQDRSNRLPLHMAIEEKHVEVVKLLIENGAKVNIIDNLNILPLHLAVQSGNKEIVDLLIGVQADLKAVSRSGMTPLHWAARLGYIAIIKLLISSKAELEAVSHSGMTPLHAAACDGRIVTMKLLIENGADVNFNNNIRSPLHAATCCGQIEAVELLIKNGADVNAIDCGTHTPLHDAAYNNYVKLIELLIKNGADVNAQDGVGQTPMHYAACGGHTEAVELFIKNGADIYAKAQNGRTLIDYLACTRQIEGIKRLMAAPLVFHYSNGVNQKQAPSLKKYNYDNDKDLNEVVTLQELASNCLTKNAERYDDNAKKIILEAILNFDHEDRAIFDDIIFKCGKNPKIFNTLSKIEKNKFMKKVKNKHLSIIQSMIQLKNEDGTTKEIVEYLNKISDAKQYNYLAQGLRNRIEANYKKLLDPAALLECD